MNKILLGLFLVMNGVVLGQKASEDKLIHSLDLIYGTKVFQQDFSPDFNSFGSITINRGYKLAGAGFSGKVLVNGVYTATCGMHFLKIIPQSIAVNDSTTYRSTGHLFGLTFLGIDFFGRSENVDAVLSGGFDSGRIKLSHVDGFKIRNGMFAPKVSLMTKIKLKRVVFGVTLEYAFDVSNTVWKRNDTSNAISTPLNNFKQSGFQIFLNLGMADQ